MSIDTYYINLNNYNIEKYFDYLLEFCSTDRINSINKYKNHSDKFRSAIAGAIIYNLYKKYTGSNINPKDIIFNTNKHGKPYIVNDTSFIYNISHSSDRVIVSVYKTTDDNSIKLGCDVEIHKEPYINIAKRFFTTDEYKYLLDILDDSIRKIAFFRLWTAKESYLKCIGIGLTNELNSFDISLPSNIGDVYKINNLYLKEYNLNDNYSYTICSSVNDFNDTMIEYKL